MVVSWLTKNRLKTHSYFYPDSLLTKLLQYTEQSYLPYPQGMNPL